MDKINWEQEYYKAVAKIEHLEAKLIEANEEILELNEDLADAKTPSMKDIELIRTNKALREAIKFLIELL